MDKNKIAVHLAKQVASVQATAPADLEALKALALAATPGPWIAKDSPGAGLEIYMDLPGHVGYPSREYPAFSTANADCKQNLIAYEAWMQFPEEKVKNAQAVNALFIAAANPAVVLALIDRIGHLNEALKLANDCLAGRPVSAATKPVSLEALRVGQQAVPEGWKLVPIEPTIEMMAVLGYGGDVDLAIGHAAITKELEQNYTAMLAAAPVALLQEKAAPADTDWMLDRGLIYRLNEQGTNCDEINVTMSNGSRSEDARHAAAAQLLALIVGSSGAPSAEDVRDAVLEEVAEKLESQHAWISNVAAANVVRALKSGSDDVREGA